MPPKLRARSTNYRVKRHVGRRHAAFTGKLPTTNSAGHAVVVGVDEAGRAPLAGPVVAAACYLSFRLRVVKKPWPCWTPTEHVIVPVRRAHCDNSKYYPDLPMVLIADSKKLTEEQREIAFAWITEHCPYGIGMVEASLIDVLGILGATERAMQEAVRKLSRKITPTYLLIDGRDKFWFDYPNSKVIHGDLLEPCIAAASIIAKVTRDRYMVKAAKKYPHYSFEHHKGYATSTHIAALRRHGSCALHRMYFLKHLPPHPTLPLRGSPSTLLRTGDRKRG